MTDTRKTNNKKDIRSCKREVQITLARGVLFCLVRIKVERRSM